MMLKSSTVSICLSRWDQLTLLEVDLTVVVLQVPNTQGLTLEDVIGTFNPLLWNIGGLLQEEMDVPLIASVEVDLYVV